MEEYSRLLLLFYRKATTQHPQKHVLIRKLHAFIHRLELAEKHYPDSATLLKPQKEEDHGAHIDINEHEKEILNRGKQEWGLEWVFISLSLHRTLLFAVLHKLIEAQDFLNFKSLEEKLNIQLEQSGLQETTLRVISYEWFRIGQILLNKKKLRWEKLLAQSVRNIPEEFDHLFINIFEGEGRYQQKDEEILAEIGALLKAKVKYWEFQGRKILQNNSYGLGKEEINICFLHDLNKYIVCSKPPQQSSNSKQKQQVLKELRLGFASLLQQYQQGTSAMSQLSQLSGVKLNEWKVMTYLGKR